LPSRRPSQRFFGRLLPPPVGRDERRLGNVVTVEPKSDPAADAALKRRIEKQIRDELGTRLRSYEVRVVGREVTVVARPARFWQRRAVRGALEALPALSGYKSRIEVVD
jgi:hypothetical protein